MIGHRTDFHKIMTIFDNEYNAPTDNAAAVADDNVY